MGKAAISGRSRKMPESCWPTRATLAAYQIVILGRNAKVFLSDDALVRLKQWLIEKDGSLVCFRGAPSSQISQRLGELMPVRWTPAGESRFRVQLTGAGQSLRWLPADRNGDDPLAGMPSLATVTSAEAKPALAVVLAAGTAGRGQPAPMMTYQQLGGRVVVLEGAGMWRWAFLSPQYQKRDEVYGSLWRSLVRWLVANVGLLPSEQMALRTDKVTYSSDENASATLLVRDSQAAGPTPRIELSGGTLKQPRMISCVPRGNAPGQFHAALGQLPEGRCLARVVGAGKDEISAVATFDVQANLKERLNITPAGPDEIHCPAQRRWGAGRRRRRPPGPAVRPATQPQPAAADHPRHGLGPLVGAAGGLRPLGWLLGTPPLVGTCLV